MPKKRTRPAKTRTFPKQIYVKWEKDPNQASEYLIADETPQSMEDGDVIGIYEFRETKTKRVTETLE